MKVLFVGEGAHDIGRVGYDLFQPRPAAGVVPTLARKICPIIAEESIALQWRELTRRDPATRKRSLQAKVTAAIVLAARSLDCAGVVCVHDCDGQDDRLAEMEEGRRRGIDVLGKEYPVVCGLAVDSIEAWTLADPDAIATVLGIDAKDVRSEYPRRDIESLLEGSGKPEHQPKSLLERITQLKHRPASTEFREAVAELTAIETLESTCPRGFQPFAAALRLAFGSSS